MLNCTAGLNGCCKTVSIARCIFAHSVCYRDNDITDILDETFTTTEERFGEMVTIELRPKGGDIPVTEENKSEYVNAVVEYRISKRVREQFEAFMTGFNELVPQDLIMVFDEREIELLIGGMSEIDVYVFPLQATYAGVTVLNSFIAMTGRNSPITGVMTPMTKSSSGSGRSFVAGRLKRNPICSSSPRELREYP